MNDVSGEPGQRAETSLPRLFTPLRIGATKLPCRIVSASHQTTLVHEHLPTEDFVAYQEARAAGGVGLIVMEAVAVAPSGLLTSHTLGGYLPEMVDGYRRVASAVQMHGTKLFVQLFHGGRELISSAPRPVVVSSSAIPSHRYHTEPRALRTEEVSDLVAAYARSAAVAAAAGIDGIEVTAAHGYLAEQFFRQTLNAREDRYGEPLLFLREVLERVRDAAPELVLGVRLSADSEAAKTVVGELAALVDYIHVALGDSSTFDGCAGIVPPPPTPQNAIAELTGPFRVGVPLIATSRVIEPAAAERMIGEGRADAVGMTRALIADPDLPKKTRSGASGAIIRCIGCNACIAHYHAETPIRCAQNPRTGRERTFPRAGARDGRRLVIVGAGPAGLAAAAEAIASGDRVVLFERAEEVGGQIALAARAPGHRELGATLLQNYAETLGSPRLELRLGVEADAGAIESLTPELVVLGTGARPYAPPFALAGVEVVQVWELLAGRRPPGRIVLADWGGDAAALDCAELLAAEGREVTLVVGAVLPGETLHQYERNQYLGRLARAGVRLEQHLGLRSAANGSVRFANIFAPELETEIEADSLGVSLGRVPEDGLAAALAGTRLVVVEAGDCLSPRGLEEAIGEGTLAAMTTTPPRTIL